MAGTAKAIEVLEHQIRSFRALSDGLEVVETLKQAEGLNRELEEKNLELSQTITSNKSFLLGLKEEITKARHDLVTLSAKSVEEKRRASETLGKELAGLRDSAERELKALKLGFQQELKALQAQIASEKQEQGRLASTVDTLRHAQGELSAALAKAAGLD